MPTSFLDDLNGPAINKDHIATVVSGTRKEVPDGWVRRRVIHVKTDYGFRTDIIYEYPDGSTIRR